MLYWVLVRNYNYYNVKIPTISEQRIKLYDSIWSQRMRSKRDATMEELMDYVKSELQQTFLVKYVINKLTALETNYEIEDRALLIKTYQVFFTIIKLYDEEIGKLITV